MANQNLAAAVLLSVLALSAQATQTAQQAPTSFKLTQVDVVGAKRYSPAEVVKVSGLIVGLSVAAADLDTAARRLASTGLFKNVKYRYVTNQGDMMLTFEMEEEPWTTPVVFDNFIWFTNDELTALVQQSIPQFNRVVPSNAGSSAFLQRELQRILESRQLPGRVEFVLAEIAGSSASRQFVFKVAGAGEALRVCTVRFDGAKVVPDAVLQDAARELKDADYSRVFAVAWTKGTLRQLYLRRGHWKSAFADPVAVPDKSAGCGLAVTISVSEGPAYAWDHAEWIGNAAVTAKVLDTALGMKAGELADVSKIETGLRAAQAAYTKQGYLQQSIKSSSRFDDAAGRIVMEMAVVEGPQFAMGTLEILGASPSDEANLRKKWRLKQGEVYDGSYLPQFVTESATPIARSGPRKTVAAGIALDPATRQVTVRIEFK